MNNICQRAIMHKALNTTFFFLCALCITWPCFADQPATYDESFSNAGSPAVVVMIAPRQRAQASERAIEAVHGELADLAVSLTIDWIDESNTDLRQQVQYARNVANRYGAIAVFWADLSVPDQVFLFISQPSGERILVRNIESGGGDEERLETLALIIRGSIKAVLEGGKIGIESPNVPTSSHPPATPEQKSPSGRLETDASYVMTVYSKETQAVHGGRIGLSLGSKRFRFFAAYEFMQLVRLKGNIVSIMLIHHPIEFGTSFRLQKKRWSFETAIALEINPTSLAVTVENNIAKKSRYSNPLLFSLLPSTRVAWSAREWIRFFFSVSIDISLNHPEYVLGTSDGQSAVFAPWIVRPIFQFGSTFAIL